MGNKSFRFKQFEVFHDKCAMKVGTDGVLLGAWARVEDARSILDIGTGTGLIALMLAQRNNYANIVGIDIDSDAAIQAKENVEGSIFSSRIVIEHSSLMEYVQQTNKKFDVIVSNPPYFINSLESPHHNRAKARHANSLALGDLLLLASKVITTDGRLSIVYPYDEINNIEKFITEYGWFVVRRTDVYSKVDSIKPIRILLELGFGKPTATPDVSVLHIEVERHKYTDQYKKLTKDFYLKM